MNQRKVTTAGWQLYILCKDGDTNWFSVKYIKHSYPVELAYYAKMMKIYDEPVFAWWVAYVQKKRGIISSKLKSKYWQQMHKYEILLPNSVKEAYELDEENNNNL